MSESLLDKEFLARLEYLHVVTREMFIGHSSAARMSRKFGVGMEFADFRSYSAGDDFRYLDWAAYARRGDLLVKLFVEEQSAPIFIVVDASRSMSLGSPQKLFFAKKIAAALGYIGIANLDAVTMVTFDEKLRSISQTFQGRGKLRSMLSFLDAIEVGGQGSGTGATIQEFVRRYSRGGIVVMLSDFFDRAGYQESVRLLHYHHFDLLAIQINDREELEPSFTGDLELIDAENGDRRSVRVTPDVIAEYKQALLAHYSELESLCKSLRRRHLPVVTDAPFESLIFQVFRQGGLVK